ncbi:unnamed protein product [Discula destructiva]
MGGLDKLASNNPFRHLHSSSSNNNNNNNNNNNVNDVPPPAGPPPGYQQSTSNDYAPPPGPPPNRQHDDYAPPPGPPPPPQHDWQSVPLPEDTAGYPPPPYIFTDHDRSWANNATEQQAEEGERWCRRYPLIAPFHPANPALRAAPTLITPQSNTFHGTITQQQQRGPAAVWTIRTDSRNNDHTVTAQPPLYAAARDDPRANGGRPRTVYFEVRVLRDLGGAAGVAIGFVALPYPGFRMPGWHRGSLAVHSDDGHRYVNDPWGGIDFVRPWGTKGVVVGVGMTFSAAAAAPKAEGGNTIEVEMFFTRNGEVEARWDVNEQRDQERPLGVQGFHDLVAAVGSFDKTEFEVVLEPARWVYKGVQL